MLQFRWKSSGSCQAKSSWLPERRSYGSLPRRCAKLGRGLINPHPKPDGRELDEGQEVFGQLLVARRDAAELLETADQSLHDVPTLVSLRVQADRATATLAPLRRTRLPLRDHLPDSPLPQELPTTARIIRLIRDQRRRTLPAAPATTRHLNGVQRRFQLRRIVPLPGGKRHRKRMSVAVGDHVNLRRQTPTTATQRFVGGVQPPPFLSASEGDLGAPAEC